MCVGGGQKSKISVFDRLKQQILAKQVGANGGTTVNGKTTPTAASTIIEGVQGNTAGSAVAGDRVAGAADPALDPFGLAGLMSNLLKIGGQSATKTTTDPNAVGAGRIGRSFGASDLRIGR